MLRPILLLRAHARIASKGANNPSNALRRLYSQEASNVSTFDAVGRDVPLKVIPRAERHQLRRQAAQGASGQGKSVRTWSLPSRISFALLAGSVAGGATWAFVLDASTKQQIQKTLSATPLGSMYNFAAREVAQMVKPFTDPSHDKLLPDWPIPQVPANMPQVPVLVLDLEDTLVHSEWDRKHGWRHAKRPGVDEFLKDVSQRFEVVVFSQNPQPMAEEIVAKLDPQSQCVLHVLGRDATRYMNGTHVKDLSNLNRPLDKVLVIDDDPSAYQLQPENAIPISPYTSGRDRNNNELRDLLPFLRAVSMENVRDVRQVLAKFRDEDGVLRDLPTKYSARLRMLDEQEEKSRQKGLGGFLRGRRPPGPKAM